VLVAFKATFVTLNVTIGFINAGTFMQKLLGGTKTKKRKAGGAPSTLQVRLPTPFGILLFFHGLTVLEQSLAKKKVKAPRSYATGNRVGEVVLRLFDAFTKLSRAANLGGLASTLAPYILYVSRNGLFTPLRTRQDGFAPETQRKEFGEDDAATHAEADVNKDAWERSHELDVALRHVAGLFLDTFTTILQNHATPTYLPMFFRHCHSRVRPKLLSSP